MSRNLIILTIISLLVSSCSINHHLKRSERQLNKAIQKGYVRKIDSVFVMDTTIVPEIKHDTATIFMPGDTIVVEKERLKYSIIRSLETDSIFIEAECQADTVFKERLVQVNCDPIYIKMGVFEQLGIKKWWQKALVWIFVVGIILALIYKRVAF